MQIKVEFDNKLTEELKEFSLRQIKEVDNAIKDATTLVWGQVQKKIQQGSRSGRIYRVRGGLHQAGADGEPPKTDTGRLVGSIHPMYGFLTGEIGTNLKYAGFLEEGANGVKHPFLKPTLEENQEKINELVGNAIQRALKG